MTHPSVAPASLPPSPGVGPDVGRVVRGVLALLLVLSFYILWRSAALPALSTRAPAPPAANGQTVRLGSTARAPRPAHGRIGSKAAPHPSRTVVSRTARRGRSRAVRAVSAPPPARRPPAARPAQPAPVVVPEPPPPVAEPTPPPPRAVPTAPPAPPSASTPPEPDLSAAHAPLSGAQPPLPPPSVPPPLPPPTPPPLDAPQLPVETPGAGALAIPPPTG
jgi:hypothetical protein